MDTKDLIGLNLALLGTVASIVLMCAWPRIRGLAFFLLVAGTVVTDKLSINFFSHYWYRGTTRGIEFTVLDALAIGMLVSLLLFPPPGQKRWYWPGSLALMLVFFLYACGSVMVSEPRVYGVFELSRMIRGLVFFVVAALFVRSERE